MTSKEAMKHKCRPGYWLENVAPLGETPDWREVVAPIPDDGKLFGYDAREFMSRQYKRSAAHG